jgi:hypothetical protein
MNCTWINELFSDTFIYLRMNHEERNNYLCARLKGVWEELIHSATHS